jgi:hypothetical protein
MMTNFFQLIFFTMLVSVNSDLYFFPEKTGYLSQESISAGESSAQGRIVVIDDFDSYTSNEELSKIWYHPGYHGGPMVRSLEPVIKDKGAWSLKCSYTNLDEPTKFYSPVCRVSKWDASGCNAFSFWFRPDGSGREMTIQFNIANREGKNIHDLWEYTYYPAKGDSAAKTIVLPFADLRHNIKYADAPDVSPVFKPEALIEVAMYIGGRNDKPGSGAYYFDSLVALSVEAGK